MIDKQLLCLWAQQCAILDPVKIVPAKQVYILAQKGGVGKGILTWDPVVFYHRATLHATWGRG